MNHEDCWEILQKVRKSEIVPVISEAIAREYIYVPYKVVANGFKEKLSIKQLTNAIIDESLNLLYDYFGRVSKLIITFGKKVDAISRFKNLLMWKTINC